MSSTSPHAALEPEEFLRNQAFLRRLARSLVHDEDRAEDLVQDTWTAWAERAPRGLASTRAWLARVLRNRARNARRETERRARREGQVARPDRVDPGGEAEATLEVQSRVVAALRKLEEPHRTALVLRYYHDLAPGTIADRTGAPLNTVKARLARGLEKLRGELDRRYGGDRGAWCHWLLVLGGGAGAVGPGPGGGAGLPAARAPKPGPGALAGAGANAGLGLALLGWFAVVSVVVLAVWWPRRGEDVTTTWSLEESAGLERPELAAQQRVPIESETSVVESAPSEPENVAPFDGREAAPPSGSRVDFDWPQFGGSASHDNYRKLRDEIASPKVLWFAPGCAGQPTLRDGDLYSGGVGIVRIDPVSGAFLGGVQVLDDTSMVELARAENVLEILNDARYHTVAAAPAITRKLVLVRRLHDGGVTAFDRSLEREMWRWNPEGSDSGYTRLSGCLIEDRLFVFTQPYEVIALRVDDGSLAWRFPVKDSAGDGEDFGIVGMVPASDGRRVFLGTRHGIFFAVDIASGEELWRVDSGLAIEPAFGVSFASVFLRDRVVFTGSKGFLGEAWALDAGHGTELWRTPLSCLLWSWTPGVGRYCLLVGMEDQVARLDLGTGRIEQRLPVPNRYANGTTPVVVGDSLVIASGIHLEVRDFRNSALRWAFRLPPEGGQVQDFVHAGERVFVATTLGLFCLADDPAQPPVAPGFVLEWSGEAAAERR